jgi:hypothetical protein
MSGTPRPDGRNEMTMSLGRRSEWPLSATMCSSKLCEVPMPPQDDPALGPVSSSHSYRSSRNCCSSSGGR